MAVIAQQSGDAAAVVYDAAAAARARGIDVLIADTAGRLHTQHNLMEELKKVRRVLGRLDESAPHETLLVVDAGTGQNALNQAREFHQAVGVSGIIVTKQKTAYEILDRDWSSDVCSSDLIGRAHV